jgi:hypothetical protein
MVLLANRRSPRIKVRGRLSPEYALGHFLGGEKPQKQLKQ